MPEEVVVCNTSPLLYLHQVGQLALLARLYGRVLVPEAVERELHTGIERGIAAPVLGEVPWIVVEPLRERALLPAVVDLGSGEAEAIALALSYPGSLLILDDGLGRKIAGLSSLKVTGTLGVLLKAKQLGLLAAVAPSLDALQRTTMWLGRELIQMVLTKAGEA
jgi:predicted nucleic acid-binding protein